MGTNLLNTTIRATGFTKPQEVEVWWALYASMGTLTAKLDMDSGVTGTDYGALCHAAIFDTHILNSQGVRTGRFKSTPGEGASVITPVGFTDIQRHRVMYDYINAWETLCEKLDADGGVTDTDYEALCYTAKILHVVKDPRGVTDLGNGAVFYFKPGGSGGRKQLIEMLYNLVDALETLTEKLDADGTVNDTNYEALTYTAYCTMKIENAAGSVIGN